MAPTFLADRAAYRQTLALVAEHARAKLPECNGRIESAVKLVLAGDVAFHDDGTVQVGSTSDPTKTYTLSGQACDCQDFSYDKAPGGWCQHRLAAGMAKRVGELLPPEPAPAPAPPEAPLPEAPVSITLKAMLHGHEVLVTLRGTDFSSVQAQVEQASTWLRSQTPTPAAAPTPQCPTHGALKPSTKGKGWYCPHKLGDGSWCKGA